MQEDPTYKQMVRKSFILRRLPDLQIPMVKKQAKLKHEAITTLSLATIIHLLLYPLDTIKTRLIARSSLADISHFQKNNVASLTTYLGIARGYASILIGNVCHIALGRDSLVLAAGLEGLLKTWIDMSKINKQMGNAKGDFQIMKKSFLPCAFFSIVRDVLYRCSYVHISNYFHKQYLANSRFFDERKRVNNIFISVIAATIISQPFEVCFVKAASQRELVYSNILKIPGQIIKEDGYGKLLLGGFWARIAYNTLSTMLLINFYDPFLNAAVQTF